VKSSAPGKGIHSFISKELSFLNPSLLFSHLGTTFADYLVGQGAPEILVNTIDEWLADPQTFESERLKRLEQSDKRPARKSKKH